MKSPATHTSRLSTRPAVRLLALSLLVAIATGHQARAQWNPTAGQWGRTATTDLRVMTWNVRDTLCSTNSKVSGANNWTACARIVAALRPDVLLLQETADNSGNGTGTTVDSVANLTTTIGLFLNGGNDPFKSGSPPVTAYVQLYAPGFTFPYLHVSASTDGYNRNCILSRYPFGDLNGDGRATLNDISAVTANGYAPGGNGGIRGFEFAEIQLPAATFAGDLVIGNAHLKSGTAASDHTARVTAAQNVAYYIDAIFNGLGQGAPDPQHMIGDSPAVTAVLDPETPVILGGDWNEDEAGNGATAGPTAWLTRALNADASGGTDGTDRNRTDMLYDSATEPMGGATVTIGNFKSDYLAWQDSIVTVRRAFIFNTASITPAGAFPPELVGYPTLSTASSTASDHRPVVADFIFPAPLGCNSAASDRGFAKLGAGNLFPRFSACGGLGSGQQATFTLSAAAHAATTYIGIAPTPSFTVAFGGTIVPNPVTLVGPFTTTAAGVLTVPVSGGGGPFTIYAQCAIIDAQATFGVSFSNALRLDFLP